jgi:hypothetical protein
MPKAKRTKLLGKNRATEKAVRIECPPRWLEVRIRQALAERARPVTPTQFERNMKAIVQGC